MSLKAKPTIQIDALEPSEIAEASVLMSRAYNSSPLMGAALGESTEKQRSSLLETMYKMMLKSKSGRVYSAKEDGTILGVMRITAWPQCQKEYGALQGLNLLLGLIVFRGKALRLRKWLSTWGKHDPNKPHLHLSSIGVLPERQGQGIGSLLLGHFCEYVDEHKQAAYLETDFPRNVGFYERFGFAVVEEEPVFSVPNWFMWRDAVSSKRT